MSPELPPLAVQKDMPILKKNRLSTGIPDLDLLMEGGYTNPANILVLGPSGMEKTALGLHFAAAGIKNNETAIFITTDATPDNMLQKAASLGIEMNEKVVFIDCYSTTLGGKEQSRHAHMEIPGPSALEEFSVALKELLDKNAGRKIRVIFNTLSTFLLYNPKESMMKFLQVIGGRLKNAGATTLIIVEEGVHDKQLISTVERSMDDRIVIVDKGGSYELEVTGMGLYVPIKMGPNGIMIV